ncbi:Hsp70 family protein [Microbacterium invictum]|uniref:Hsp70 family protein n=1 Tax=Microbacterium invictum TaxID=515415 RepID=A0ABZ0V7W7_9MICO|nr:Hsp70 family protein [Microbacterium invictum]WQB69718.1 Hsp70 family protein [Microbacterium invictum]
MATGATYFLGIDVGTTRIAAATARTAPDGSIVAAPFPLGRRNDSAATVVFVADDGELLIGDAAERRGITQPDRLVREFKRSIGDDVPVVAGGRSIPAEKLWAHTVSAVVDAVVEREGSRPAAVMLTHPTAWGPHRIGLILSALDKLGVKDVHLITEPEAAARHYESGRTMEPGQALAVYDLGGGTFDSVVLRKSADGSFAPVGIPVGIDNLGGADFDDAVFRHVLRSSGVAETDLDDTDPDIRLALAQLRRECVEAKEALSFDSDVTVPVLLPSGATSVRLTRQEFEEMIDGSIERTIDTLEDGLDSAGLEPDALESILLIGGSSRIPLVAERLSERLDRPIAIDADPKSSIALGAARALVPVTADESVATLALVPVGAAAAGALATTDAAAAATTDLAVFDPAGPAERKAARRWYQRVPAVAAAGAGALVIATGLVFASAGGLGAGTFDAAASTENLREWVDVELTPSPAAADELQTSDPIAAAQEPAAPQARQDRSSTENKPKATNARKQAAERNAAVRPPEQPKPAASQSATSGKPSSSQPTQPSGGGTGSNTPAPGTSTPAPGTSTPAPDPTTTTPAPDPTTTTPAPDPTTTTPAPDPTTTTPAPDPTTTTPAPDPTTTTPAPDPTTPASEPPASEPPASEPPADTTPAP